MPGRYIFISGLLITMLGLCCCKKEEQSVPVATKPLSTRIILAEPIEPTLVDLPNEALPVWRRYAEGKPTLAILSQMPYLAQIPAERQADALKLLTGADDQQLVRMTSHLTADAVILPSMTISAALEAGYFSQVLWVFPSTSAIESLSTDVFRNQLVTSGIASEDEVDEMAFKEGILQGTLRGIPFQMVHPQAIPRVTGPVVLHIDPSFFQPIYKGEIKTPLYAIVTTTLASLRAQEWPVAAATIVRPSPAIELPLATRFLADDIAGILKQPSILLQNMPEIWELRSKALYLENFMQKDEIRRLYQEMERKSPRDPAVMYALYQIARQDKDPDKALDYLKTAVSLDPTYAYEYLHLADLAMEKQLPKKSVQMLQLAQTALPQNPYITLRLARALINIGHRDAAKPLVEQLGLLHWSPLYFSEIIAQLRTMTEVIDK